MPTFPNYPEPPIPPDEPPRSQPIDPDADTRLEAFVKGAELGPVAEVLRKYRDEILRRWLEAAREQPFHAAHPDRAVADHIPRLFDALAGFLDRAAPRSVDPEPPLHDPEVREAAQAHARSRFEQGLGVADVVTEFRLLRQEIGRALRAHFSDRRATSDLLGAELLVQDALDGAAAIGLAAWDVHLGERQAAERERAELFRELARRGALLDHAYDAIFACELGGPITYWNRGAERLYGYCRDEAVGRVSHELLRTPPEEVAAILAALERDGRWEGELSHVAKDGRHLQVESRQVRVEEDGRRLVLESNRDVTSRRRAEERVKLLAEAGATLAESLDYHATLANVARLVVPRLADWCAIDLLGPGGAVDRLAVVHADPAKVRLAEELRRRYPPNSDNRYGLAEVLRTGQPELLTEIPAELVEQVASDPEQLALLRTLGFRSSMIVPLRARGQVLGAISFVAAESGRRYGADDLRTAEELADRAALAIDNARLYREAREALDAREQLLAVVAHDLRSPLTAIKGNADLLRRQVAAGRLDPERLGSYASTISRAAGTMSAQIGELLDAARLRAGERLELARHPSDLVALVFRVAEQVQATTDRHTIDVEAVEPELIGDWDAARLERVLGNLLGNAVKYSPQGGDVAVDVQREDRDGRPGALLTVRDRGIGIPSADLPRIFARYQRAANVVGRFPGEGIGLSGARQIVEQHGGTIGVDSREGQGSTFTVWLPLVATN